MQNYSLPKKNCKFTIITCSNDDTKYNKIEKNVRDVFKKNYQLIRIEGTRSIAEGYNRGMRQAEGDILIFCHDDIVFLNHNTAELIQNDLKCYDIVGVAGTSFLTSGSWIGSGQPFTHGQVIHKSDSGHNSFSLNVYGLGRDNAVVTGIQALDGLFFAVKREVLFGVRFDEKLFDGFHFYDIDFTYAAYLKGARIIVDHRIHLLHYSGGKYDQIWEKYENRFRYKYPMVYTSKATNKVNLIRWTCSQNLDKLIHEMNYHHEAKRLDVGMITEKESEHVNLKLISNRKTESVSINKYQKFPCHDDSINYTRFEFQLLSKAERDYLLSEMVRIGRHGAIVECISIQSSKNNVRFTKPGFVGGEAWPKQIKVSQIGKVGNGLLLMGMNDDKARIRKAYYQVSKNVDDS